MRTTGSGIKVGLLVLTLGASTAGAGQPGATQSTVLDTARAAGQFTTLVKAIEVAGLSETLSGPGPFTVFAPTDRAFARLPSGTLEGLLKNPPMLKSILLHHVSASKLTSSEVLKLAAIRTVLGQSLRVDAAAVTVDGVKISKPDIAASNGIIHVVDAVLMPQNDIIESARQAGSFTTLLTALEAADLTEALRGAGPFTVFAPTDEAFSRLPPGKLQALLASPTDLKTILTYHVVSGKVLAADVVKLKEAKSLEGRIIKIDTTDGVKVNQARVVKTDIQTTNGVIHVIDAVITPE